MSFAFPASHCTQRQQTRPLTEALARAKQAAAQLRWTLVREEASGLTFKVGLSLWSWGEEVQVGFGAQDISVHSRCHLPMQCFDSGKNRQNCEQFALAYGS